MSREHMTDQAVEAMARAMFGDLRLAAEVTSYPEDFKRLAEISSDVQAILTKAALDALQPQLRRLVDLTWQYAREETTVPSTKAADTLIAAALKSTTAEAEDVIRSNRDACMNARLRSRVAALEAALRDIEHKGKFWTSIDQVSAIARAALQGDDHDG